MKTDDDGHVASLLKQSQTAAVKMMSACNTDPLDIELFEFALVDFVQALPTPESKGGGLYDHFYINWRSNEETSLSIAGYRCNSHARVGCSISASKNSAVLGKIAPILLEIVALKARDSILQMDIRGFETASDTTPSTEDVFQAFSKAGFWRKHLRKLLVSRCHMNAVGDCFEVEGTYPESLEEAVVCWPSNRGGVESSTIYKVASCSPHLRSLATGTGGTDMLMTNEAIDVYCGILRRVNTIDSSLNQRDLSYVPDNVFARVMEALTTGHSHPTRNYGCRYDLLNFHFDVNQYRDLFRSSTIPRALVPFILDHCQRKTKVRTMYCAEARRRFRRDILFYLLRERVDWIV